MAFKWGDAFVLYTADTDVISKGGWTTVSFTSTDYTGTTSPFGYGEIQVTATSVNGSYQKTFAAASGRIILQGRFRYLNGGVATNFINFFNNGGADTCLQFSLNAAGGIVVTNAASGTVHTTAAGVCAQNVWHYFGIDADIGNSSGIVKMWLNQPSSGATPLISLTGIDMTDSSSVGCDKVEFLTTTNSVDLGFADLCCMDSSGGSLNAYQGEKRWYVLPPTADGSSVGWTASAGSDYQCVDDTITANSDGDSTNVQGAAGSGAELFTSAALPSGVSGVVYVGVRAEIKKTDGGVEPSTTLRITNGTATDSAALALSTTYTHYQHGSADNPGGSGWTVAQANAIEFGMVAA